MGYLDGTESSLILLAPHRLILLCNSKYLLKKGPPDACANWTMTKARVMMNSASLLNPLNCQWVSHYKCTVCCASRHCINPRNCISEFQLKSYTKYVRLKLGDISLKWWTIYLQGFHLKERCSHKTYGALGLNISSTECPSSVTYQPAAVWLEL